MMACKRRIFENRVLRIFGPRRNEVTGEWRKLHNDLNDEYCSENIIQLINYRRMNWVGHAVCTGVWQAAYRVLVGKPEGKNIQVTET
jgi:hypothetical protein